MGKCKDEDLSSNSQYPFKKLGMTVYLYKPKAGVLRTGSGDWLGLAGCQLALGSVRAPIPRDYG